MYAEVFYDFYVVKKLFLEVFFFLSRESLFIIRLLHVSLFLDARESYLNRILDPFTLLFLTSSLFPHYECFDKSALYEHKSLQYVIYYYEYLSFLLLLNCSCFIDFIYLYL